MASERDFGPNQLTQWLGLEPRQFRRAQARGLIPPPDIDDERWSLTLAKTVPDRLEEIAAALGGGQSAVSAPAPRAGRTSAGSRNAVNGRVFGPIQLAKWLGLENWQVPRGVQLGVIPPPDVDDKRWAEASVTTLPERVEEIRSAVGDHPGHGSIKAAEYLAERTKKDVERVDVQTLAAQGLLHPVAEFKGHPMYSLESLDTLPEEQIAAVVRRRHAWIETSLTPQEAATLLGWPVGKFEVTAERRGLTAGPLGRFPRADVEGLRT
ncbi:hypothetical protein [Streptomyces niveus]|uniref:DNA-binding protein n=1 Tax=Streptomyces niveus TaxID=193462 RepID=A0A1U9QM71_STRNV|nr:hypothetical protein [Streptomyces niveus]AQU65376.1 hypothetical protein BBN63_03030 [Streptomyces niveus]